MQRTKILKMAAVASWAVVGSLSVTTMSAGCGGEGPNEDSCADWRDLEQPAATSERLPDEVVLLSPGDGRAYPGFYSIGDVEAGFDAFTTKSDGRAPPIVFTFHDWATPVEGGGFDVNGRTLRDFNSSLEEESMSALELMEAANAAGGIAAFAWDALGYYAAEPGYFLGFDTRLLKQDDIIGGTYDSYIRHVAGQIADSGVPVMLSPLGEFGVAGHASFGEGFQTADSAAGVCDQYGDPAWPDGPERIRDLYRHVIDIFREEGATNVTWFMYASTGYMNPQVDPFDWEHPAYYYPGDAYIDWIGNSLYFTNDPNLENDDVRDLGYALDDGLAAWREITDKPFFAPEFGISTSGDQSAAGILGETLDALPGLGVSAFTYADAPLFASLFAIPRLATFDDEKTVWNEALSSEAYELEPQFSE